MSFPATENCLLELEAVWQSIISAGFLLLKCKRVDKLKE